MKPQGQPPRWRSGLLRGLALAFVLGLLIGRHFALFGLVALPLTALERWAAPRGRAGWAHATGAAWVVAATLLPWALVQSIHLEAVVATRSWEGGYQAAWEAFLGLSDPRVGPWSRVLPWAPMWTWVLAEGALATTAMGSATLLALPFAARAVTGRRSAGLELVVTTVFVCVAPLIMFPPEVPPGHTFTSAQGLEEGLALTGYLFLLALVVTGWSALADERPQPADDPPPATPHVASIALTAVGVAVVLGLLVVAPRAIKPTPRAAALAALDDPLVGSRLAAARTLAASHGPDAEVAAALARASRDPDPGVRCAALGGLGVSDRWSVGAEAVRAALSDPHPAVRLEAARAITGVVSASRQEITPVEATPDLARVAMSDPDPDVREWAVIGLFALGAPAVDRSEARAALIAALRDGSRFNTRVQAAHALGRGSGHPDVVDALGRAVEHDPDPSVRTTAAAALRDLGPAARSAAPSLRRALAASNDDHARGVFAEALSSIE